MVAPRRRSWCLGKVHGGALVGEPSDVGGLVILGRPGPRDEDRRRARDGDLGDRRRAAAADEQVGGGVDEVHPRLVADDPVDGARSPCRRRPATSRREALAGDVIDGQAGVADVLGGVGEDRLVERSGTL